MEERGGADAVLAALCRPIHAVDAAAGGGWHSASYDGVQVGESDEEDGERDGDGSVDRRLGDAGDEGAAAPAAADDMDAGTGRAVTGVAGARVRRRRRFRVAGGRREAAAIEYDVFGSCALETAEALDLDPEELARQVEQVAEGIAAAVPVHFSYDMELARPNPRAYNWSGSGAEVLGGEYRGRPTLVVLWSAWSPQSVQVLEEFGQWAHDAFAGRLLFVAVNIDNDSSVMVDKVKQLRKARPTAADAAPHGAYLADGQHFWAGYGVEGDWRRSPAARAFVLETVPAVALVDDLGAMVSEGLFLPEAEFSPESKLFRDCVEQVKETLTVKVRSILTSMPRKPDEVEDDEDDDANDASQDGQGQSQGLACQDGKRFPTLTQQDAWLDRLCEGSADATVVIDEVFSPDQSGRPTFQYSRVVPTGSS